MPNITPRADEYGPVVEALESDEYDDAKAMAKGIVKLVWHLLTMRETYALVLTEGGRHELVYGPYSSENEAEKAAKKLGDGDFGYLVIRVFGSGVLEGNIDGFPGGGFGFCRTEGCGHMQTLHYMNGASRGKCSEDSCECTKYKK